MVSEMNFKIQIVLDNKFGLKFRNSHLLLPILLLMLKVFYSYGVTNNHQKNQMNKMMIIEKLHNFLFRNSVQPLKSSHFIHNRLP